MGDLDFSDLIPQQNDTQQPTSAATPPNGGLANTGGLSFSDLIPQQQAQAPQAAPDAAKPETPGVWQSIKEGAHDALHELLQTKEGITGDKPTDYKESAASAPYEWDWYPHESAISKTAYRLTKSAPTLGGGLIGAGIGSEAGPLGTLAGGALGAGAATAIQGFGKTFKGELDNTPDDPDGAYNRALKSSGLDAVTSSAAWAAFGLKPFSSELKNIVFQAAGIQPGVSVAGQAGQNVLAGQDATKGLGNAYVEGAVGTAVPMAGHAIVSNTFGGGRGDVKAGESDNGATPVPDKTDSAPEPSVAPTEAGIKGYGEIYEKPPSDDFSSAPQSLQDLYGKVSSDSKPGFFTPKDDAASILSDATGVKPPITDAAAGGFNQIPDGPIGRRVHGLIESLGLGDLARDIQMKTAPMAARDATIDSRSFSKDFANYNRLAEFEGNWFNKILNKEFKPDELKSMWEAADEQSVLEQQGLDTTGKGLDTLTEPQRATVRMLQKRADDVFQAAKDVGVVEADAKGLPSYAPRMVAMAGGERPTTQRGGAQLDAIGKNLTTTTPNVKNRKYLTTAETEEAAQKAFGDDAHVVRDIRTLPYATMELQKAVAGKALINKIKELGRKTGEDTVYEGAVPEDVEHQYFTLPHPAFKTWKPKLEKDADGNWKAQLDANGKPIFEPVPISVRKDFEGPLRSVLSSAPGEAYKAAMALKSNAVGLIMYSPLIHNQVEWGRALPVAPGKVFTGRIYFEGYKAKNDFDTMREFVKQGGVPIGDWRGHGGDLNDIMSNPGMSADKGWLTKGLRKYAGDAPADVTGKALNFWHQTMLWDRIADLQMGLYQHLRDQKIAEGVNPDIAQKMAAHWANRYAGAVPPEAMADGARRLANLTMFSRSFTVGNLGVAKDMFMGLPSDVQSQIARDHGLQALMATKSAAQWKAIKAVGGDMAINYVANSLAQNVSNTLRDDRDDFVAGYARRFNDYLNLWRNIGTNPSGVLVNPFSALSATHDNEPGKRDRVYVGNMENGTGLYARLPMGKIGEEFLNYATGPIDMMNKKQSTLLRPIMQILANDKGFGHKIYDPNAENGADLLANGYRIAKHFVGSQLPDTALEGAKTLATGEGTPDERLLAKLQTLGPLAGMTFSRGYPGGPAEGIVHKEQEEYQFRVNEAKPELRKMILRGDNENAQKKMTELGMSARSQKNFIKNTLQPNHLTPSQIRTFNSRATPEQQDVLQRSLPEQASGGAIRLKPTYVDSIVRRYSTTH